jgi:hypothetical protein
MHKHRTLLFSLRLEVVELLAHLLQSSRQFLRGKALPLDLRRARHTGNAVGLGKRGVRVLTASGDDLTDSSDPSRKMMRQIAGSFAEYEGARLVAKLKAARERKRLTTGKCEGRKSHAEINPEMVRIAKGLRRRKRGNSLRAIAAELAARGYVNVNGRSTQRPRWPQCWAPKGSTRPRRHGDHTARSSRLYFLRSALASSARPSVASASAVTPAESLVQGWFGPLTRSCAASAARASCNASAGRSVISNSRA